MGNDGLLVDVPFHKPADIYTEICPWKSPVCTMVSLARLHCPPPNKETSPARPLRRQK